MDDERDPPKELKAFIDAAVIPVLLKRFLQTPEEAAHEKATLAVLRSRSFIRNDDALSEMQYLLERYKIKTEQT